MYPDYPQDEPALYMKLDDHVADIVGEPRACWYRFLKYVYGLPAAGKTFYEIYRDLLFANALIVVLCLKQKNTRSRDHQLP